jgi:hypothetical protein
LLLSKEDEKDFILSNVKAEKNPTHIWFKYRNTGGFYEILINMLV